MLEAWEMIRHVAEVLGMIFLPILGWMLLTLTQHSKKIILLEERVNETISKKLSSLEESFEKLDNKVDVNHDLINKIGSNLDRMEIILYDKYHKLDTILEQVKNLSKK